MASNRTNRTTFDEFPGINLSASPRLAQGMPKVMRSFDFERDGAYRFGEELDTAGSLSGRAYWSRGQPYTERGMWLSPSTLGKLHNETLSLSGTSVDTLDRTLVSGVGVVGNFDLFGPDQYTLGGAGYTSGTQGLWDWPRVSGVTVSAGGSGATLDAGTYDVLVVVFAPTSTGLVAYQSLLDTGTVVTSGQELTVTLDDVLPSGFGMRAYVASGSTQPWGGFPGTNTLRQSFSDGSSALSLVFDDYDATDATNPTTDAFLRLRSGISSVEPHLQRVWTRATDRTFAGPFYRGYDTAGYWHVTFNDSDTPSSSSEALVTTPDAAAMDTAFDGNTEFGVIVTGIQDISGVLADGASNTAYGNYVYFARRDDGSGGDQFAAGIRWVVSFDSSGECNGNAVEYFMTANDTKVYTSADPWDSTYAKKGARAVLPADIHSIEFETDLTAGTGSVTEKDINGNTIATHTLDPDGGAGSSLASGGGDMTVMEFPTPSVPSTFEIELKIGSIEVYEDSALSTLFDDVPASEWDGTSGTTDGTNYTWTFQTDYFVRDGYVAAEASEYGGYRPESTIAYSDIGFVNYASSPEQQLFFALQNSEKVTALVSTPAGLLVLADNEAFMVRGDPALTDSFSSQRVSGTIGCDDGVRPARMGGAVVTIWQGKLYAATFGMGDVDFGSSLQEISRPVYQEGDPFVQVVGDVKRREFVALTLNSKVYRYHLENQQWYTDPYTDTFIALGNTTYNTLLPTGEGTHGVYYPYSDTEFITLQPYGTDSTYNALLEYQDVDAGDPTTVKLWRRVRMYLNEGYVGAPTMYYDTGKSSATVYGYDEGGGEWVFTFRAGVVGRELRTLRFTFTDGEQGDFIEPPLVFEFVPKYTRR